MDEKNPFGAYIRKKRQEAGLTQRQLADRLYVSEPTVSKWERGLSCPDIALIPNLCRELGISEHEFFTACDDQRSREQEKQAKAWRCLGAGWRWFFGVAYAVAILACFICDLAIFHALDWFWIVLAALALAFSFTNLPFLVKRDRVPICLAAASVSLLLLLLACWRYLGMWQILGGGATVLVCLLLPWCWWVLWRFYGRHLPSVCLAAFSLWVFLLLAVISAFFGGGGWLLRLGYPIAGYSLLWVWAFFAVGRWLPGGGLFKGAAFAFLTAWAIPLSNRFAAWLVPAPAPALGWYFSWERLLAFESTAGFSWVNILVFQLLLVTAAVLLTAAIVNALRRRG